MSTTFFPLNGATNVCEDVELKLTFSSTPSLGTGAIKIYNSSNTLVDTINTTDENLVIGTVSGSYNKVAVKNQLVYVSGNSVIIKPHTTSAGNASVLANGSTYYVQVGSGAISVGGSSYTISDTSWKFTIRSTPSISSTITVGKNGTEDFYTLQGAFNYLMANKKSGDYTIKVSGGKYYEFLHFNNASTPNVTIIGDSSSTPQFHWQNGQSFSSTTFSNSVAGVRTRSTFVWQGGNLTLKNLKFFNDLNISAGGNLQAETLEFDKAGKKLAAYNCKFSSYQDTIYIGTNVKAWFYKCEIVGDVDTIWGYADTALFEKCTFSIAASSKDPSTNSYQFETRIGYGNTTGLYGKGFVALNCTIKTGDSTEAYYLARRASSSTDYYDQVAFINPKFSTGVTSSGFLTTKAFRGIVSGSNVLVGANVYNVSGVTTDTSKYIGVLSSSVYKAEYSTRDKILNKCVNSKTNSYQACSSTWDLSTLETLFGL